MKSTGKPAEDFDAAKQDEYAAKAKARWGSTDAYREYESKAGNRSREQEQALGRQMMDIFAEFGKIKQQAPDCEQAKALVKQLQSFITAHYYTCTDKILLSLGQMYAAGGDMTANIDAHGGEGTAAFANQSIQAYVSQKTS